MEFKGLIGVTLVFVIFALVLFTERSGIRYSYNRPALDMLPAESIVTKTQAMAQTEKTCLVIWNPEQEDSAKAWRQFEMILTDMKVGFDLREADEKTVYNFADYETVIVLLRDLSVLGEQILPLCDWVYDGGGAMFPLPLLKETYFSVIETKLGINESSYKNALVDTMYVEEDFMIGAGRSFEITDPWESALAVQLMDSDRVRVYSYTDDSRRLPLIWESRYGKGKFVVDNFGLCEKSMRGFYAASYSLLRDVCAYPVINGSSFYLDDFPSQVPSGDSVYIRRDYGTTVRDFYVNVWWEDMMTLIDKYGVKFTGLAIECYDDAVNGETSADPDKSTFLSFGSILLRKCGEVGYHGYNHQPLCLSNCDYRGIYEYKTWESEGAMRLAFENLVEFCDDLLPDVTMSVYVPPSNILSDEGRAMLLREFPQIRTISGSYFEDAELNFSCAQEFDVNEDGIVDQPRIVAGCIIDPFMQLSALSELNMHYVNNHFTHPDDALDPERGAEIGWEAMYKNFNSYLSWLYSSAPNLRNFTGSELSAAVQRFAAVTVSTKTTDDMVNITLGNFYDEAQLMVRFNDKRPGRVSGGTLEQLTDTLYLLHATEAEVMITLE